MPRSREDEQLSGENSASNGEQIGLLPLGNFRNGLKGASESQRDKK